MIDPQFLISYCISRKDNIRHREREGGGERDRQHIAWCRCILHTHIYIYIYKHCSGGCPYCTLSPWAQWGTGGPAIYIHIYIPPWFPKPQVPIRNVIISSRSGSEMEPNILRSNAQKNRVYVVLPEN